MITALPPGLRRAVSPHTGIVRSLEECLGTTADPPLFRVAGEVGRGRGLLGAPLDHLTGIGGSGLTLDAAAAAAVGEALERYSASYVPSERLVVATAIELGGTAVRPERFALFSDRQHADPRFPFRRFTADTRVAWIEGRELRSGRIAFVPAELVFLRDVSLPDERPIGYATSSGAACADSRPEAIVRGLCELLERDAFMIVWTNRLSLPLLAVGRDRSLAVLDDLLFAGVGLRYAAVDLSAVHRLPSVLGVVRAPTGVPGAVGVGAGTATTIDRAWLKALAEAFGARSAGAKLALRAAERAQPLDRVQSGGRRGIGERHPELREPQISSFEDHIIHYADHGNASAADFLTASPRRRAAEEVPGLERLPDDALVEALCERVEAAGSSAYVVDITAPDVRELGLTVAKVLAPELCSLDVPHAARFLGGRRLYEASTGLGLRASRLTESEINPDPHPFP